MFTHEAHIISELLGILLSQTLKKTAYFGHLAAYVDRVGMSSCNPPTVTCLATNDP